MGYGVVHLFHEPSGSRGSSADAYACSFYKPLRVDYRCVGDKMGATVGIATMVE